MNTYEKLLQESQKGATARLMSVEDVEAAIKAAEKKLGELRIPKKCWTGCRISIWPETVSNSYSYRAEGTAAVLERGKTCWKMVEAYRTQCGHSSYGGRREVELELSDEAHAAIPKRYKFE